MIEIGWASTFPEIGRCDHCYEFCGELGLRLVDEDMVVNDPGLAAILEEAAADDDADWDAVEARWDAARQVRRNELSRQHREYSTGRFECLASLADGGDHLHDGPWHGEDGRPVLSCGRCEAGEHDDEIGRAHV